MAIHGSNIMHPDSSIINFSHYFNLWLIRSFCNWNRMRFFFRNGLLFRYRFKLLFFNRHYFIFPLSICSKCVLLEIIIFHHFNQLLGISRVGSITAFFKTFSPSHIITHIKRKKLGIAHRVFQIVRMVLIRIFGTFVFSETFIGCIICMCKSFSTPFFFTFNSKMIIGLGGQYTFTCTCFVNTLC